MTSPAPGVGEAAPVVVDTDPPPAPTPAKASSHASVLDPTRAPSPTPEPELELETVKDEEKESEAESPAEAGAEPAAESRHQSQPDVDTEAEPASEAAPEADAPAVAEPEHAPCHYPVPDPGLETPPQPRPAPAALAAGLPVRPVRRIPASGERLGRFTLAEALGHGGFAHVYRALADDGAEVALKVLTGLHDDARERFVQEAHLLERLDGRGFPRFVEAGLDAAQPWFAMELVPGTTLRDRVHEEGPLSGSEALRLAAQLVDALLVLQEERCLHRDLKPANIMVDGDRAVLIDLGIAKVFDAATSTQPAGTMAYMAPELFGRRVHPRSDVYSLGLLLVYASTGTLPLDLNFLGRDLAPDDLVEDDLVVGPPAGHADDDTPPEALQIDEHLQTLVLAMTRYQPNHRPPLENIAQVLRARRENTSPDPTLLLTSQVVADGVTAAEVAALPATDPAPRRRTGHTGTGISGAEHSSSGSTPSFPHDLARRSDVDRTSDPDDTNDSNGRSSSNGTPSGEHTPRTPEPWHKLVYDRALMNVLAELHADGFDGAAEEVVADHVAEIGAHVAGSATPAEIKDWIWHAMRWQVTSPADGHSDTLRGWRAFRSPEFAPSLRGPLPRSFQPRKSPVKHLGPTPRPAGAKPAVHATRPMPVQRAATQRAATQNPAAQDPAAQNPASQRPAAQPPTALQPDSRAGAPARSESGTPTSRHPGGQPGSPTRNQPRSRPGRQQANQANQAVQQVTRPGPARSRPATTRPATARSASSAPASSTPAPSAPAPSGQETSRRTSPPRRLGGILLRWVPRLLLVAAVCALAAPSPAESSSFLAAPAFALAALGMAALLRVTGHAVRIWFYVLAAVLVGVASAVLTFTYPM